MRIVADAGDAKLPVRFIMKGKFWPEASRIRVFMLVPGVEIPHLCFQCEDYPCVEACPIEAVFVNSQSGAVNVDVSKCTACALCIKACPGNVPHLHPRARTTT